MREEATAWNGGVVVNLNGVSLPKISGQQARPLSTGNLNITVKMFGQDNRRRVIVNFIGFLDLLAVSLVIPAMPVYLKSLGTSSTMSGMITSIYGALQLFSSPVVGKWSDENGRIAVLRICLLVCASGYLSLAFVMKHLIWISLVRIIPGLFKHTQDLSRCLLLDEDNVQKNQVLGTFNALASIGFIIGPTVHGHLVGYFGMEHAFLISNVFCASIFIMNFLIVSTLGYLYEVDGRPHNSSKKTIKKDELSDFKDSRVTEQAKSIWKLSQFHQGIFATRFLLALSVMIFRASFVLWLHHYHPDLLPTTVGYIHSFNGCLGLFCGFIVGPISNMVMYKHYEEKLQFHAILLLMFGLIIPILSSSLVTTLVALSAITMATSILRVCGIVLTVKDLPKSDIGQVQGLGSSVISIARFAAPFSCGILQETSYSSPNLASFVLVLAGCIVFFRFSYSVSSRTEKRE